MISTTSKTISDDFDEEFILDYDFFFSGYRRRFKVVITVHIDPLLIYIMLIYEVKNT
jgi:hypothetical protein